MNFRAISNSLRYHCVVCGEEASHLAESATTSTCLCPQCKKDWEEGHPLWLPALQPKSKGTHWVLCCFWAILFATLIFLAAFKAIELIDPPVVPPPIPLIGERFTEHEKDHLTLLSQVAAQDLLKFNNVPLEDHDPEYIKDLLDAMRWAEQHSNSPFANQ